MYIARSSLIFSQTTGTTACSTSQPPLLRQSLAVPQSPVLVSAQGRISVDSRHPPCCTRRAMQCWSSLLFVFIVRAVPMEEVCVLCVVGGTRQSFSKMACGTRQSFPKMACGTRHQVTMVTSDCLPIFFFPFKFLNCAPANPRKLSSRREAREAPWWSIAVDRR